MSSALVTPASKQPVPHAAIKKSQPVFVRVESLHPESRNDNLIVQVVALQVVLERTRIDGTPLKIAEVLVGDATGTIILTCRNEQLLHVQVGSWLYVRNSKVDMFAQHMRLAVDRWGLIEPVPVHDQPKEQVNTAADRNLSNVQYEFVALPQ